MGHRITWRSRPRSDYPWPLKTVEIASVGTPDPDYLIGPFPMDAVLELLYRVKKFRVDDEYDILYEPHTLTEKDIFEGTRNGPISPPLYGEHITSFSRIQWIEPGTSYPGDVNADIFKTADGYYLRGRFRFDTSNSWVANWAVDYINTDAQTVDFVLSSGTYTVTMFGGSISGTPTITATEWWPYKTTAGLPAWDTATGAPINGGPGA